MGLKLGNSSQSNHMIMWNFHFFYQIARKYVDYRVYHSISPGRCNKAQTIFVFFSLKRQKGKSIFLRSGRFGLSLLQIWSVSGPLFWRLVFPSS